jgi:UDP-GlcNAc:undecaprenyl-phosphate GlcNAc-1-phosphate transferase
MKGMELLLPFLAAVVVAAIATPIVSRVALAFGAIDRPCERKVSQRPSMPLLGGLGVALGFFVGLAVALLLAGEQGGYRSHLEGLLLGALLLLAVGAVDDRFSLTARTKLMVQVVAAAIAILYGFRIDHITEPVSRTIWWLPAWLAFGLTTLWIVGITNAMNLLDGLDGLATGVGAIITATLTWICWQAGHAVGVGIGVAFLGALLGFLPFNFPPARIFLGDTGALFIGYVLSLLTLEGYRTISFLTFLVPLLVLAVPLIDITLSVIRRVRRGIPIMSADRLHIHHLLLQSEGSQRPAVLSLYFLTACFSVIAVSFTNLEGTAAILFFVLVIVLTVRLLRNLGFLALDEAPKGVPGEVGSSAEKEGP